MITVLILAFDAAVFEPQRIGANLSHRLRGVVLPGICASGLGAGLHRRGERRDGMPSRRFPPPWSVEESPACFTVADHAGQKLAYFYFEREAGQRSAAKLLTRDEAFRLAVNFAKPQWCRERY